MIKALIGLKKEMTQVFSDQGKVIPVTKIVAGPCVVTQIKKEETDGYTAVQIGFGQNSKTNQAQKGHLSKSGKFSRFLREIECPEEMDSVNLGTEFTVDQVFQKGDIVKVTGINKGKGFAGGMKRWGFHGGPKTHGQGIKGRSIGSIGSQGVGKVFKGKKMPGHMGARRKTVRGLKIVEINPEENSLLIKGSVPGNRNSTLLITKQKIL